MLVYTAESLFCTRTECSVTQRGQIKLTSSSQPPGILFTVELSGVCRQNQISVGTCVLIKAHAVMIPPHNFAR